MKHKQSDAELRQHLQEQIQFLLASAKAYDEGNKAEAKRLALHLRILLHDTSESVSLLKQLGKKGLEFYDTMFGDEIDPSSFTSGHCMTVIGGMTVIQIAAGEVLVLPKCLIEGEDNFKGKSDFDTWWNAVIYLAANKPFTRQSLIRAVANEDGGAHIGPTVRQNYADLTRHNLQGLTKYDKYGVDDLESPVLACLRQIAFEVLKTLSEEFPEYFRDAQLVNQRPGQGMIVHQITFPRDQTHGS